MLYLTTFMLYSYPICKTNKWHNRIIVWCISIFTYQEKSRVCHLVYNMRECNVIQSTYGHHLHWSRWGIRESNCYNGVCLAFISMDIVFKPFICNNHATVLVLHKSRKVYYYYSIKGRVSTTIYGQPMIYAFFTLLNIWNSHATNITNIQLLSLYRENSSFVYIQMYPCQPTN